jgi:hypothetical protein
VTCSFQFTKNMVTGQIKGRKQIERNYFGRRQGRENQLQRAAEKPMGTYTWSGISIAKGTEEHVHFNIPGT